MLRFLKYFFKFFISIDIYYSNKKKKYKLPKNFNFYFFKSFSNIKSDSIKKYFYEFKQKKKDLKKVSIF